MGQAIPTDRIGIASENGQRVRKVDQEIDLLLSGISRAGHRVGCMPWLVLLC
jgi:hypothetical protein